MQCSDQICMVEPEEGQHMVTIKDKIQPCFKERPSILLGKNFVGKTFYRGRILSPCSSPPPLAYNPATHFRHPALPRGRQSYPLYIPRNYNPRSGRKCPYLQRKRSQSPPSMSSGPHPPPPTTAASAVQPSTQTQTVTEIYGELCNINDELYCNHCKSIFEAKATYREQHGHYLVNHKCCNQRRTQFVVGVKHRRCRFGCNNKVGCIIFKPGTQPKGGPKQKNQENAV